MATEITQTISYRVQFLDPETNEWVFVLDCFEPPWNKIQEFEDSWKAQEFAMRYVEMTQNRYRVLVARTETQVTPLFEVQIGHA